MALLMGRGLRLWGRPLMVVRTMSTGPLGYYPTKMDIGKREVVGFGMNGEEVYTEDVLSPFPAIRFKEDTAEIAMLREKEKGDWKKLTVEEKKTLYRAAFCQTMVEMDAPSRDWRMMFGFSAALAAVSIWIMMWLKIYVYPPLPETITDEERVKAQIKFMIEARVNPVQGLASMYDYEKGTWKI
eukprot:maker-scaffold2551_size14539-snap-gene-0.4 protein:Tk06575 transcript:maker-scaffold2551_size14539-snap-gene-0.4-mRNA-1 annotation:"hypothetical protein DAPPUDRAFT_230889"